MVDHDSQGTRPQREACLLHGVEILITCPGSFVVVWDRKKILQGACEGRLFCLI